MNKQEFIAKLESSLKQLPQLEKEHVLNFYNETIEDRIEEGTSEEDAISNLGTIEDIVSQVLAERDVQELDKTADHKKSHRALRITILVITSPLWIMMLAAALLLYLSFWLLLAGVVLIMVGCVLFLLLGLVNLARILQANTAAGVVLIGTLLFILGCLPFLWMGCKQGGIWLLHQAIIWWKLVVESLKKAVR